MTEAAVDPAVFAILDDKMSFERTCREHTLPTAVTAVRVEAGAAVNSTGETCDVLPRHDLFVKPASGRGGQGAELWIWEEEHYRSSEGRVLTSDALLEELRRCSADGAIMVQRRIASEAIARHFRISGLPTIRILTGRSRSGDFHLIAALFKVPRAGAIVDNLTAGSIGCPIDAETGRLGPGYARASLEPVDEHPDTRAALTGFQLPDWEAAKTLALRAHRAFDQLTFAGWDIALTDAGPVLIEGNAFPAVETMQRVHGPLLDNPTFRALCLEQE